MRSPVVTRSRYDRETGALLARLDSAVKALLTEYDRATRDGRAQVHAWAREATYNVFHGGQALAAFQEAEKMFAPSKPDIEEVPSAQ